MSTDLPFTVQDRRKRGYFTIDNVLLDVYGKELGPYGIAVYAALARFANQEQECWPSRRTIHERTGVSIKQVNRELLKLAALEIITITPRFNDNGEQTSNLYVLLDIAGGDVTPTHPPVSGGHPPNVRQTPKQSPKKKDTPKGENKKDQHRNYVPDEYADIIIH